MEEDGVDDGVEEESDWACVDNMQWETNLGEFILADGI
jgi:hypothetical protein